MPDSPFEVVGVLSYDPETDSLSPVVDGLLTERVHGLQAALDHVHGALDALTDPDGLDHQCRAYLVEAKVSLTVARDATADRIRASEVRPSDRLVCKNRLPAGVE